MNCEFCDGSVVVRTTDRNGSRPLHGRCTTCGRSFSLFGGRLTPTDEPAETPKRWPFASLVERERRRATDPATGSDGDSDPRPA